MIEHNRQRWWKRSVVGVALLGLLLGCAETPNRVTEPDPWLRARRLVDAPIVAPGHAPSIGENVQGPSLIRVPDWVEDRLADYYLYFADHKGRRIQLAYADALEGPWTVHAPGALSIEDSFFAVEPPPAPRLELLRFQLGAWLTGVRLQHSLEKELTAPHIASPDVHVDERSRQIVMYFHGLETFAQQLTRVAVSPDGLAFEVLEEPLGRTYLRTFEHAGMTYALAMPGQLYRSESGRSGFEEGPRIFHPNMRHAALWKQGERLHVFWTQVGDAPERIVRSTIDLSIDWTRWRDEGCYEVLRPEREWEGAGEPNLPSIRSVAYGRVNQLRDPAIFQEAGRVFLLYAAGGEHGIGIAELEWDEGSQTK